MIYSCFNEQTGNYIYFQDGVNYPVNSDLPIPSLGGQVSSIGVPAREAGRKLPEDAVYIGEGWQARGVVVDCYNHGFGSFEKKRSMMAGMIVGIGILVIAFFLSKKK